MILLLYALANITSRSSLVAQTSFFERGGRGLVAMGNFPMAAVHQRHENVGVFCLFSKTAKQCNECLLQEHDSSLFLSISDLCLPKSVALIQLDIEGECQQVRPQNCPLSKR